MRISDWSSDVCSSDLVDHDRCGPWPDRDLRLAFAYARNADRRPEPVAHHQLSHLHHRRLAVSRRDRCVHALDAADVAARLWLYRGGLGRHHLRVCRRCDADEATRATHRQTLRLSLAAACQCTAECRVPVRLRAVYRSHAAARDAELVAGLWLLPLAAVHLHQYARLCRYAANPHEPGDELC